MLRPFLISWWDDLYVEFELNGPAWVSGNRPILGSRQLAISAAIMAANEADAKEQITQAYCIEVELEWRFITAQPSGWAPFTEKQLKDSGATWSQKPH